MRFLLFLGALALVACGTKAPETYLWDDDYLVRAKENIDAVIVRANRALEMKNPSVMDKEFVPASGNKHDYMSLSRYFWPNPDTQDGLPYVTRDGESNPELEKYDRNNLGKMSGAVTNLGLAFYLTGEKKYADKAVSLLDTWFLDPETKMNPNMNYAQIVPGLYEGMGRSFGIIDGYGFVEMLDGVMLLKARKGIPAEKFDGLKSWFSEYTNWLMTSDHGKKESEGENNHSIAYDVQLLMYSLFGGEEEIARKVVEEFPVKRLQAQINPDGRQPHELTRTIAYWYSVYNLAHILDVCDMARNNLGIDIYHTQGADGSGSVEKALEFLTPYIGHRQSWPYQQIHDWDGAEELLKECLRRAARY